MSDFHSTAHQLNGFDKRCCCHGGTQRDARMNGAGYRIRTCVGCTPSAWKAVAIVLSAKPA